MTAPQDLAPRVLATFIGVASALGLAPVEAAGDQCPRFASASEGLPGWGEWRTHPSLGDVNGDGRLDIAASLRKGKKPRVWLQNGDGTWTDSSAGLALPAQATCGVGVDLADVNEDGHLDLGVADHCSGGFVFLGDGQGKWRLGHLPWRRDGRPLEDLQFGDIDGDGHLDVVGVATIGGFRVALGDGKGKWKPLRDSGMPRKGSGTDVKLVDLNRDGALDVVAAFQSDLESRPDQRRIHLVWLGDGAGNFRSIATGLREDAVYAGSAVGDVNADGLIDLAFTSRGYSDLPVSVLLGNGKGGWTRASEGLPEIKKAEFYAAELADLDGDGRDDLIASAKRDGELRVWMSTAEGVWKPCPDAGLPVGSPKTRGWGLEVADVDGDGRLDLAFGHGHTGLGALEVWLQTGEPVKQNEPPASSAGDTDSGSPGLLRK